MNLQVVGCSHHETSIALRERLAFSAEQTAEALDRWRRVFPGIEAVLLSTCNRVELYTAAEDRPVPSHEQVADFLTRFHRLDPSELLGRLYVYRGEEAAEHLFSVACSLDSMVVGESQVLGQVKEAYRAAAERDATGPLLHSAMQAALRAARRVATETAIHQRRVSVPSVAVADFAQQIFERFDDKHTVVVGAGEMAEETLRYLRDEGARRITVVNRDFARAGRLAESWQGEAVPWERLVETLAAADLVISTTAAGRPVVTLADFERIDRPHPGRPMFILDLAVPRDFDPAIGERPGIFLYSVDDLEAACADNRRLRDRELPDAQRIVRQETDRFLTEAYHRATGPVIQQLRRGWQKPKEEELARLLARLPELDEKSRDEIRRSFDRLLGKLLHPPLESLRDESRHGIPHVLLDALSRLFRLKD